MTINCLAIDDNSDALRQLSSYIGKIPQMKLVATCRSVQEAQNFLRDEVVDAVFTDIDFPQANGIQFVRSLRPQPIIVFTSARAEYAVDAYRVNAAHFLLKPYTFEDFKCAAERVRQCYAERYSPCPLTTGTDRDHMFLKTEHRVVRIETANIVYVEAQSEYLKIHLEDQKPVMVLLSMKRMEGFLPQNFMRIHRSYIINLNRLQETSRLRVRLTNGEQLPIGDHYKEAFINYLSSKFIGK